jgi:hypothetical protein
MSGQPENPLRIHLGLALAQLLCWGAFIVELRRALSGNRLSWAYTVEWPILAAYSVYVWQRLRHERPSKRATPTADEVERLGEYNDYLREVHRDDPDQGKR